MEGVLNINGTVITTMYEVTRAMTCIITDFPGIAEAHLKAHDE